MLSFINRRRRWSDEQRRLGPFTYSTSDYPGFFVVLDSGADESPGCHLRLRAFRRTLLIELPALIKPWRRWVPTGHYDWAKSPDAGYWDEHPNEYGFSLSGDGFLQLFLGPQTGDSDTTKSWSYFLPWTQWRHIRRSWYGPTGQHIETLWDTSSPQVGRAQWDWLQEFEAGLVKTRFEVEDFDGARRVAATHIEEREWRKGTGFFKWLSVFVKPKIHRSLEINFDKEVGPEKGSWKGGLCGTSIKLLPGELHESAFRRFCDEEQRAKYGKFRIKFIGPAGA